MYATQGNDVYVNLYIQSKADIETESNKINVEQTTDYPWNGKISISVTPEKEQEFALRVRIPGWAQDAPVPTDLYSFTDKAQAYSISVNGSKVNAKHMTVMPPLYATGKRVMWLKSIFLWRYVV